MVNAGVTGFLCAGFNTGSISLSVSGGVSPFTYLWSPGNQTTNSISNLGGGTYDVVITDNNNCTANRSYTISTYPAIGDNTITGAQTLCEGSQTTSLTGSSPSGGDGNYTYLWQSSADNLNWATTGSTAQNFASVTLSDTTWYRRIVSSCAQNDTSNVLMMDVRVLASAPTVSVSQDTVCSTGHAFLYVTGTLNSATQWQWYFSTCGGQVAGSGTNLPLQTIAPVTMWVRGVGNGCNGPCDSINIYPSFPIGDNTISGAQTFCASGTTATLTGSTPTGGINGFTYSWESSSNNSTWSSTGVTSIDYPSYSANDTAYYRRVVSDGGFCANSTSNTIFIDVRAIASAPTVSASQDTVCSTGHAFLYVSGTLNSATQWQWYFSTCGGQNAGTGTNLPLQTIAPVTMWVRGAGNGCVGPCDSINIYPSFPIGNNTITGTQTLCGSGPTTVLTGSTPTGGINGFTYSWQSSYDQTTWNNTGVTAMDYPIHTAIDTIWYRRIVSDGGFCANSTSNSVLIEVRDLADAPSITVPSDSVCTTDHAIMSISGNLRSATQWQWYFSTCGGQNAGTGTPLPLQTLVNVTMVARGVGNGCVGPCDSIRIFAVYPHGSNSIGSDQTLCAAAVPAQLTGSTPTGGNGFYSYQWQSSTNMNTWGNIGGNVQNLTPAYITQTTYYRRVVSSRFCAPSTSNVVRVTVLIGVNTITSHQTIPYNSAPAQLNGITNINQPGYQWEQSRNDYHWIAIGGANQATYSPPALMDHTWFRRKAAGPGCDTIISRSVEINLQMQTHGEVTASSISPVCEGSPIYLSSTGPDSSTFDWTGPNGFTSNLKNPSILFSVEANAGVYRLKVTKTNGDSAIVTANVMVGSSLNTYQALYNAPVCQGSALSLSASHWPRLTYSWTGPNGYTSDIAAQSIPNSQPNMSGVYSIVSTSPGCGTATRTVNVVINPILNPAPGNNGPLCVGSVLYLTSANLGNVTYSWTGPNGFTSNVQNPSFSNAQSNRSGTYNLTITGLGCPPVTQSTVVQVNNALGSVSIGATSPICTGSTLTMSAQNYGNTSYTWSGPGGYNGTGSTITRTNATTAFNGVYTLNVSVPGCPSVVRTQLITVLPSINATVGSSSPVCAGASLFLTTTSVSGSTYSWSGPSGFASALQSPGISNAQPTRSGVYTLTVTQSGCGSQVYTTSVSVNAAIGNAALTSNSPVCVGNTLTLTATNYANASYSWAGPGGFVSTGSTTSRSNMQLNQSGLYTATLSQVGCGSVTRTINVTVRSNSANAGSNSPMCSGGVVALTTNTVSGASYVWSGPNGYNSTVQNPSVVNVQPNQSGVYTVTTTLSGCGAVSSSVSVTVLPRPNTALVSAAQTLCVPSALTLTGTNLANATLSWAGPGGFTASGSTFTINTTSLASAGAYTYTVSNSCGTSWKTVNVSMSSGTQVNGTVHPNPICTGAPLYMQAGLITGSTYNWSGPSGFNVNGPNASRSQVTTLMGGNYTLTVNVPGCGVITQTFPVVVNTCRDASEETETTEETIVAEELKSFNLQVYPNPTEGMTTVTLTGLQTEDSYLAVFDLLGHQVLVPGRITTSSGTKSWELDFREIAKGVYFVKLNTEAGEKVERIVVR